MKIKLSTLIDAIMYIKYNGKIASENVGTAEVEITIKQEDLEEGKLCDGVTIAYTTEEKASPYETFKDPSTIITTVELFATHENRSPRLIVLKTQDWTKN